MIEVCSECGGSNIRQQGNFMFDPNAPRSVIKWDDVECEDYYYCNDCEDDCGVDEKEDEPFSSDKYDELGVRTNTSFNQEK